jgi:hypothetical protein
VALLIRTLLVLFVFAASAAGASAADSWRVVASTGAVKSGAPGATPVALNPKQDLPADSWVETGASGRAVLARGPESIAVGPNSRVMLPSQPVNGNTQVLQTMGSALYQIGKQKAPHFQVDTPYLAAVVKGTTFLVSVSEGVAAVDVTEGLVQVATPDGADSAYVQPGFTGFVTRGARDKVVVLPTADAPKANDAPSKGKAGPVSFKETSNTKDRVVIPAAIGELSLDVKAASGGLVAGTEPTPTKTRVASLGGNSVVSDTKSDGTTGSLLNASADAGGVAANANVGGAASVEVSAGGGSVSAGAGVGGGSVASVDVSAGNGGVGVGADVGGGAAVVDVSAGSGGVSASAGVGAVGVDVGVGGSNGSGSGNGSGGASVGVDLGVVGVDVTVGNGGIGVGVGGSTSGSGGGGLLGALLGGRH